MDPAVARFIAKSQEWARQKAADEVRACRAKSPSERLQDVLTLCELGAIQLEGRPDRARVMALEDPPHPSYPGIIRRLRAASR